jgi:hypothetical protein
MKYREWNEADLLRLDELAERNTSIEDICKTMERSKLSVTNQLRKMHKEEPKEEVAPTTPHVLGTPRARRSMIEKAAINFLDMRIKDRDYTGVWESILDFQNVLEEKSIEQTEVKIRINTNKWIGIAFQGDLHIGNMATDYKAMLIHRDMIAKTDNLYVVLNGDYCDNYIPSSHVAGMFEALFPPAVQKNLAKDYIETIKESSR